jgi:hypothetical protein
MFPALGQNLLHPIFLANVTLAQKLDFDPVLASQPLCVGA